MQSKLSPLKARCFPQHLKNAVSSQEILYCLRFECAKDILHLFPQSSPFVIAASLVSDRDNELKGHFRVSTPSFSSCVMAAPIDSCMQCYVNRVHAMRQWTISGVSQGLLTLCRKISMLIVMSGFVVGSKLLCRE